MRGAEAVVDAEVTAREEVEVAEVTATEEEVAATTSVIADAEVAEPDDESVVPPTIVKISSAAGLEVSQEVSSRSPLLLNKQVLA